MNRLFDETNDTSSPAWGNLGPKQKADILRGRLSYHQHYEHLMDWYMREKRLIEAKRGLHAMRSKISAALKKNTDDSVRSLNVVDEKVAASHDAKAGDRLFSMLVE